MTTKKSLEKISIGLLIFGILLFTFSIYLFGKNRFYDVGQPIDVDIFSGFGSFVGGIIGTLLSVVGVILLISSLIEQRDNFDKQKKETDENNEKQLIETRFFEYLKIVRENSEQLYSKGYSGKRAMIEINKEFNSLFEIVKEFYPLSKSGKSEIEWKADLINITYLIVFFGVDEFQYDFVKTLVLEIIPKHLINDFSLYVLEPLSKTHKETKVKNKEQIKGQKQYLQYDGHQNVLGHYFRHLFQTVTFIDKQSVLTYPEKYEYIKTLRAQLSTIEQLVFFYNSLSKLGMSWERSEKRNNKNLKLITKYNLVKNITFKLLGEFEVKDFYPKITFEGFEKSQERLILEKTYK